MSQYLEEAARVLKETESYATNNLFRDDRTKTLLDIADGYAALASIEKGLLPPSVARDLIDALTRTTT